MEYKLQIQLKSDLCASSGDSFGSLIDNDICYDKYGFPYIPAKRLKGILREEAEEYCEWFDETEKEKLKQYIKDIFGEEGKKDSGKLKIDNAYIRLYQEKIESLENVPQKYKKYLIPQKILQVYTYTRFQTAIAAETGTSKNDSLRTTRVVKRDNTFIADVDINVSEEEIKFLKNVVKLTSHMGLNRTRGYGEIQCNLLSLEEMQKDPALGTDYILSNLVDEVETKQIEINMNDETEATLKILLKAESELMLSKQNAEDSENYIPGSNILGSIAKKYIEANNINDFEKIPSEFIELFLNGTVKYSNAYITDKAKKEFYPIPFSYAKVKNTSDQFYNKMFNVDEEGIQLSSITGKFVTLDDDNYIKEVEMSENYHHQRAKDNKIGRALQIEDGGSLYQYNVIGANQYFLANITGKVKDLKKLLPYIKENDVLRVGKSKNTEYGKLRIINIVPEEVSKEQKEYKKFAVILTSDVVLLDNGKATTNKETLIEKIKDIVGQDIELERAFINYTKVSGYNIIWNLPKEQMEAFKTGSVLVFNALNSISAKESYTIGQRRVEGYGNIKIIDIANKTAKLDLKEESKKQSNETNDNSNKKIEVGLIYSTLKESIKNSILDETVGKALENIEKTNYSLNNSTIGRLMLMLEQSKTIAEFFENFGAIKNSEKLEKVKKLLNNTPKEFQELQAVKDLNNLRKPGTNDDSESNVNLSAEEVEKYTLEYIKQCLIQIKLKGEK